MIFFSQLSTLIKLIELLDSISSQSAYFILANADTKPFVFFSSSWVFIVFLGLARDVGQFLNSGIITAQTELSETTADNDQFLVYDNSAAALRKVQSQYVVGINSRTELAERAASNDEFLIFDSSASAIKKIQASNVVAASVNRTGTGDGSTVAFTVTSGSTVSNVMVFINGVYQRPTTDYTVSGTTLTFGTAPASSDRIDVRELPAQYKYSYGNKNQTIKFRPNSYQWKHSSRRNSE